jgi:hypothetical protein
MQIDPTQRDYPIIQNYPQPLLFATLSGSHLYGFPSKDSDFDIRGAHILDPICFHSLVDGPESIETKEFAEYEDEMVTHDIRKYFKLLLKNNGYILEQIFSPIVLHDSYDSYTGKSNLQSLREIAQLCITSSHHLHYAGFGYGEWKKFVTNPTKPVKRLLYVFRVMMCGIHLMRTGRVESNIWSLMEANQDLAFPYIPKLIEEKLAGGERVELSTGHSFEFYTKEYLKLEEKLKMAAEHSSLHKEPRGREELQRFLLRLRSEAYPSV